MEKEKKLIAPHTDQRFGYPNQNLPLYGQSYQCFCPKCNFGPIFSKELTTVCGICNSKLMLKRMPDATYKVVIIK